MKKFTIIAIASASWIVGDYEAETEEEALEMALTDPNGNQAATLCRQCEDEVDLGEPTDFVASEG